MRTAVAVALPIGLTAVATVRAEDVAELIQQQVAGIFRCIGRGDAATSGNISMTA